MAPKVQRKFKFRPTEKVAICSLKGITKADAAVWKNVSLRVRKRVAVDGVRVKEHGDRYILKKMFVQRPYLLKRKRFVASTKFAQKHLFKGRRVADLGSSLGCFTLMAMAGGASAVLAVEPDAETFSLLASNVEGNKSRLHYRGNVQLRRAAVVGKICRVAHLGFNKEPFGDYAPDRPNRSSLLHESGAQKVTAVHVDKLLTNFKPQVLKMDIEGAEKVIVANGCRFHGVEELLVYWHFDHHPRLQDFQNFLHQLGRHFSKVEYESTPAVPHSWKWQAKLKKQPDLRPLKVEGPAAAKKDVLVYCAR